VKQSKSNSQILIAMAVLITAACFWFSWKSIIPQYQTNKATLDTIKQQNVVNDQKVKSYNKAKETLDGAKSTVEDLKVAIPEDKDIPNLISELEKIASAYGTYIPSIQITDSGSTTMTVAFSITGSITGMGKFIKDLENDLKVFNLKSITATPAAEGMQLSLQIETYKIAAKASVSAGKATDTTKAGANKEGF